MVYTSLSSKAGNYPYQLNIAHLYGNLMNTYGDNETSSCSSMWLKNWEPM